MSHTFHSDWFHPFLQWFQIKKMDVHPGGAWAFLWHIRIFQVKGLSGHRIAAGSLITGHSCPSTKESLIYRRHNNSRVSYTYYAVKKDVNPNVNYSH